MITFQQADIANSGGQLILLLIDYTDAQNDIIGGTFNYTLTVDTNPSSTGSRSVVAPADANDPARRCADMGGFLQIQIPAPNTGTYHLDPMTLTDAAGHVSAGIAHDVDVP